LKSQPVENRLSVGWSYGRSRSDDATSEDLESNQVRNNKLLTPRE
jgi:hypothetical protein